MDLRCPMMEGKRTDPTTGIRPKNNTNLLHANVI